MLTLNHFTLPTWLHEPIAVRDAFAGVDPDAPPPDCASAAAGSTPLYRARVRQVRRLGGLDASAASSDLWVTVNEPMVVAVSGYVNLPGVFAAWFPPGVFSDSGRGARGAQSRAGLTPWPTTQCTVTTAAQGSDRFTT